MNTETKLLNSSAKTQPVGSVKWFSSAQLGLCRWRETLSLSLTHYVSVFVPETKRAGGRNSLFLREWITRTIEALIPAACLCTSCYTLKYIMDMCYMVAERKSFHIITTKPFYDVNWTKSFEINILLQCIIYNHIHSVLRLARKVTAAAV